ncbi:hypothetical protein [Paenibacillus spongiae]|uniref:WYL domain-containing protein n=1 Tax=Paenibacillus spongiae TaxID=2909671 RepID=A0ABY5S6C8_9BACL|nr:hypothetical protein [Paenibacillus spongiae]UVI29471.1 hypothetical protein L1F29_29310 [Paenibacillus spongiae]
MASLHRIQWLDDRIRRGLYPNVNQMIERFEISRRQALRDVEYLRDSLGAPLDYCPKQKGYRYTHDAFAVPGQLMTEDQQELLSCLAAHYEVLASHHSRSSKTLSELALLLLRLSGRQSSTAQFQSLHRAGLTPFQAILQHTSVRPASGSVPSSLQPFYRGRDEHDQEIYEFYDSYEFLPALLASGRTYSVVHPKWLRQKLVQYLDRMHYVNRI